MNVAFYAIEPLANNENKATTLLKLEKKGENFIVHKDSFEYVYPLSEMETYKQWILMFLQPRVDLSKQFLMITDCIGIGTLILKDFRDLTDIVGKVLDTLKAVSGTNQPEMKPDEPKPT